jgi:ADP-dependent phosphofructokinase/glucokinase
MQNISEVEEKERELVTTYNELKVTLDTSKKQLIENYEQKLEHLKEELDLRMKVEIHEIEERKNQHINDLMKNH